MVYTIPRTQAKPTAKAPTLYSLFQKSGNRYVRVSEQSYPINTARYVYQDRLINGILQGKNLELRRIN